jgi:hypothetical protein
MVDLDRIARRESSRGFRLRAQCTDGVILASQLSWIDEQLHERVRHFWEAHGLEVFADFTCNVTPSATLLADSCVTETAITARLPFDAASTSMATKP